MSFETLFKPLEAADAWLTGLFSGARCWSRSESLWRSGLRHASDPDHLVAVTSLVAADGGDRKAATRLGVWWGIGHAGTLLLIGLPLIFFKSELPAWLEAGAEKAVGVVILLLAVRVIFKWMRGDYRATAHEHHITRSDAADRHPRRGDAAATTTATATCARRARRSRSARCTGWPARARSCCC